MTTTDDIRKNTAIARADQAYQDYMVNQDRPTQRQAMAFAIGSMTDDDLLAFVRQAKIPVTFDVDGVPTNMTMMLVPRVESIHEREP